MVADLQQTRGDPVQISADLVYREKLMTADLEQTKAYLQQARADMK
jgi:hypothetical protein